jgi:flagellar basal body rod protein FlgB
LLREVHLLREVRDIGLNFFSALYIMPLTLPKPTATATVVATPSGTFTPTTSTVQSTTIELKSNNISVSNSQASFVTSTFAVASDNATVSASDTKFASTNIALDSENIDMDDNVLDLNQNETGYGITKSGLLGGLNIKRGALASYKIVFDDNLDAFTAGFDGSTLERVALVLDGSPSGLLGWNGSKLSIANGITSTQVTRLNAINQNLATTDTPSFAGLTIPNPGTLTMGSTTLTNTQLARLSAINQNLATTDSPTFSSVSVSSASIGGHVLNGTQALRLVNIDQDLTSTSSPTFYNLTASAVTLGAYSLGSTNAQRLVTINQNLGTTNSPTFVGISLNGQSLTFPSSTGTAGYILSTNGSGVLSWVAPPSTDGGSSDILTNGAGTTKITTTGNQLVMTTDSVTAITVTSTATSIPRLHAGSLFLDTKTISSLSYTILGNDSVILYNGSGNGDIYLPASDSNQQGRVLYLQNLTNYTVMIHAYSGDLIGSSSTNSVLYSQYDFVNIISNGNGGWIDP